MKSKASAVVCLMNKKQAMLSYCSINCGSFSCPEAGNRGRLAAAVTTLRRFSCVFFPYTTVLIVAWLLLSACLTRSYCAFLPFTTVPFVASPPFAACSLLLVSSIFSGGTVKALMPK